MMTSRTVVRRKAAAVPATAKALEISESQVTSISKRLVEPAWLREKRLAALNTYSRVPLPSTSDEAWRRTDLKGIPGEQLELHTSSDVPIDPGLLQPLASEVDGALMAITPGHPTRWAEVGPELTTGAIFADWATAVRNHAGLLQEHLGVLVPDAEGKFAALATAMVDHGAVVYVPAGAEISQPLHSVVWAPGGGRAIFSRILVVVERGASLTYVHEVASPSGPGAQSLHAGVVEIVVGEGATLTFVELQNWGAHVWNLTHERARVGRDGRIDWIFGAVGSHLTKNFTELSLAGQGAAGRMSGLYFANGVQHLDHDTQQNHLAPDTKSDLLFKGALLDKSRSVWQGMIYVAPAAQKTDGYQANRNLILSQQARADSIPGLEILADDVRCTHGATVGQLEEEPLYYLMSRGLPRKEAERLVVDGFFTPVMQRVPFEGIRERLQRMIDEKMGTRAIS